jgi:hypothetical protein
MTPKEKAEELVERFNLLQTYVEYFSLDHAKQCTLICVDEILNNSQRNGKDIWRLPFYSDNEILLSDANYWQQVKTEIENI